MRKRARAERKIAIVLFNFPPNAGNTGTAAYLSVFASLFNTLTAMKAAGYQVEVPESVDALRERIIERQRLALRRPRQCPRSAFRPTTTSSASAI